MGRLRNQIDKRGVPAAEVFPEMVRKGLEKAFPKAPFETLNAGVPGYSSSQGMLSLETILPRFRPDVGVAEFGHKRLTPSVNFLTSYSIPMHKTISSYPHEVLNPVPAL